MNKVSATNVNINKENNGFSGLVSLVGAGPGDPDLLTLKALRLLQNADVVVYDRLVSDEIMQLVSAKARLIFVGKQAGHHCVPQQQINEILIEQALQNQHVVRLKGGDPFIFGRGGEELEALLPHNIAFDIVPGVTAAAGCAAYAGIPLTHRDHAQGVEFVTGHLKSDGSTIAWQSLAQSRHTLVFYMGLTQSAEIETQLMAHGLAADTPIAIIEKGTTAQQKVFTGTLSELSIIAQQAQSPSLIIVGSVTQLHHSLGQLTPYMINNDN